MYQLQQNCPYNVVFIKGIVIFKLNNNSRLKLEKSSQISFLELKTECYTSKCIFMQSCKYSNIFQMKICLQSDHKNIKCSCLNHPYFMNSKVRFTHQLYPVVYTLAQDRTTIHKNTEVFMK